MARPDVSAAIVLLRNGGLLPWSGGPLTTSIQVADGPLLRGFVVELPNQNLLVYAVDPTEVGRVMAALSRA